MAFLPRFDIIKLRAISFADLVVWLCRVSPGSFTDRVEDRSTGRVSFSRISVIAFSLSNAGRSEVTEKSLCARACIRMFAEDATEAFWLKKLSEPLDAIGIQFAG